MVEFDSCTEHHDEDDYHNGDRADQSDGHLRLVDEFDIEIFVALRYAVAQSASVTAVITCCSLQSQHCRIASR